MTDSHPRDEAREATGLPDSRTSEPTALEAGGLYQLLVSSVQDYAIFALDVHGRIASWNDGASRIKGYAAGEIIGQHFSRFYPADAVADGFPELELKFATRHGRFEDEGWRVRKDGSQFWANVVITALRDHERRLVGFAKVTRDLTERRAAEDRRVADARRIAAAEAANRTKSEFLAAMSHELRTPLNAIGGYTDLLLEGVYGEIAARQYEPLERIQRSQQHLLTIITDLLNYSRIEAGRITYDVADVPVQGVIETVCAMIDPLALRKGVRLDRRGTDAALTVRCDRARTEQILLNLLSNAIKFTPAGGHVTASARALDDYVAIEVRDSGVGIPRDQLEAVFEPFVQVGRALNRPNEGTGLGLAIARDLARAMGGELGADAAEPSGAVFTLTLPRSTGGAT